MLPVSDWTDVEAQRARTKELIESTLGAVDTSSLMVEDRTIPGPEGAPDIAIRIYTLRDKAKTGPSVLYIHGGGFAMGDLDTEHAMTADLASQLGVTVVSVDYRLAPENPFPAGLEDCYATLAWLHTHASELGIDADRIAVFGRSAGGGLTAALALLARDRGGPKICFQFLGIPELDDGCDTVSMRSFVDTPLWNLPNARLSWQYYLGDSAKPGSADVSPYAAPSRATDLKGLPPAYVATSEFDPLRDEGISYALRMMQAGVPVELHTFAGAFHGSIMIPCAITRREQTEAITVMRRALQIEPAPSED